jgi:hypothetical protein
VTTQHPFRRHIWALLAVLLVSVGAIGSFVAANAIARSATSRSQKSFVQSSTDIAATLKLAIQHENDLVFAAQGFILGNSNATESAFLQWAGSVRAMARYPELLGFGSTVVVPASQLSAYEARALADPGSGLAPSAQPFVVIPPGNRSYYCFSVIGSARNALDALPLGYDLCGGTQGKSMLLARDSGQTDLQPFTVKGITDISIAVPIYRGTSTPQTVAARRKAFVGWVGMSLVPGVILTTALSGHPNTSVILRFGGTAKTEFRSGVAPSGAQTERFDLHDGWTVQTFADVSNSGLLGNAGALALLIAGIALGLLLGALIYLLGTGRARAIRLVEERTDEIRFRALHDSLTGLPNRALILDRVDQMLARARRSLAPTAAMFLDLDNFKDINDTMGHQAGDLRWRCETPTRLAASVATSSSYSSRETR